MFKKNRTPRLRSGREKNIHLDYAATTPVDKKVLRKMLAFFATNFYNPSSIYKDAKRVKVKIEEYRSKVAKKLQVKPSEIFFTNGGTESINIAILGLAKKGGHIISTKVEHPAVLETLKEAERLGCEVTLLDVDEGGLVSVEGVKKALRKDTALVTICYATSELGTVQPIRKIAREILKYKEGLNRNEDEAPFFHTDAAQAGLTLDLNVNALRVDMMSLDGSKIYGPKASGCLVKKQGVELEKVMFGGGQEGGLKPGTENVAGIIGFCEALLIAIKERDKTTKDFKDLQNYMLDKLEKDFPEAQINGSTEYRLSNNVNICIKGIDSEFSVIFMDEQGINCSAMTACKSMKNDGHSYAIEALDKKECASSSLRFSFGKETTKGDIDKTLKALRKTVDFQFSKA
jgi:cysteine desulfurase